MIGPNILAKNYLIIFDMTLRQFVKIFLMRPGLFYHAINEDWFYLTINNNLVSHITSLFFADEIKPHPIPYQIENPDQWSLDKNCKNTPLLNKIGGHS